MLFLPYERIVYESRLSQKEIIQELKKHVGPKEPVKWGSLRKTQFDFKYNGIVNPNLFQIVRNISYRNSFLPRIEGVIKKGERNKIAIEVIMRLHPFVLIFMAIWLSGIFFASVATIFQAIKNPQQQSFFTLIPLGMLVMGYGMVLGGFKYESKKSREFLSGIFEK